VEDILAIVLLFGGGTFAAVAYSPIGRGWADRIRGRVPADPEAASQRAELLEAVDVLRREVAELAERVDFTERLLARGRGQDGGGTGDAAR
jgi:hypothetical protein